MPTPNPTDQPPVPNDTMGMAANSAEAPAGHTPPQGWTNDPAYMNLDYYWQGRNGDLKALLTAYGLPDPQPLLTRAPETGDIMFLLRSKDSKDSEAETKYYVWNDIESVLCLIKSPTSLKEIYDNMEENKGNLKNLEMELIGGDEEEEEEDEREDEPEGDSY